VPHCALLGHAKCYGGGGEGLWSLYVGPLRVVCHQAVYGVLKEAEHRSTCYLPYWNFPLARYAVPRQRKFHADLDVINSCLDNLIAGAKAGRSEEDIEALQARDYSKVPALPFALHPVLDFRTKLRLLGRP
jgi:hypothetical protein